MPPFQLGWPFRRPGTRALKTWPVNFASALKSDLLLLSGRELIANDVRVQVDCCVKSSVKGRQWQRIVSFFLISPCRWALRLSMAQNPQTESLESYKTKKSSRALRVLTVLAPTLGIYLVGRQVSCDRWNQEPFTTHLPRRLVFHLE